MGAPYPAPPAAVSPGRARGIVRVLPDGSWTPEAACHALAAYGRCRARRRSATDPALAG